MNLCIVLRYKFNKKFKKPSIKEIPQVTVNIIADIGFLIALAYFVGAGAFTTINSNVSSFKFLTFIRRLIEKVTVYEDKFTVEFKSGLTVDVNE